MKTYKKILLVAIITILLASSAFIIFFTDSAKADTGTYTIDKQYIDLTIQKDSNVLIKYDVTMTVHSGNIPWVTVGLPNSNYQIKDYGGSAKSCYADNYGSWTGVRIDLDKTYYAGDTFSFACSALQKQFIYEYENNQSSIQFTPCWWDNAITKDLKVTFHLPDEIKEVTTTKEGAIFEESIVTWQWSDVPKGQKYTVGMLMPADVFTNLASTGSNDTVDMSGFFLILIMLIISVVFILILIGISIASSSSRDRYEEPSISVSAPAKKIRHINMNCPNDNHKLNKKTLGNTTIDVCPKCGGSYFDKREMETLLNKKIIERDFRPTNLPSRTAKARDIMMEEITHKNLKKCLRCEGDITQIARTLNDEKIHIYICDDCGGIWMNKGLYQAIKDRRIEQTSLAQKRFDKNEGKRTREDYYTNNWWLFYPYIYAPRHYRQPPAPSSSSRSSSSASSCACVSCACVAACACACACAGGGAAGCSPKNQINFKRK